jgi:hypothetical protein
LLPSFSFPLSSRFRSVCCSAPCLSLSLPYATSGRSLLSPSPCHLVSLPSAALSLVPRCPCLISL